MGTVRSAVAQNYVHNQISAALARADLPADSPLRQELENAEFGDTGRDPYVFIRDRDRELSLDAKIEEMRSDPFYRASFPANPKKVDKTDMAKLRDNFEAVASGKVRVE